MKIYKYRDFTNPTDSDFSRLEALIDRRLIWCARPDTLNDPEEFVWSCDYTSTPSTLGLLTKVLIRARGRTHADASAIAESAIKSGLLESVTRPVVREMIDQCRRQIGLACFGSTPDNQILWQRYGGRGNGVCVELDVPTELLGTQLHRVQYPPEKRLHVDRLLRAFVEPGYGQKVYNLVLLSKPRSWANEEEIRFVSQAQAISVSVDRAKVTCVVLGDALKPDIRKKIEGLAATVPRTCCVRTSG
jgi:hypothetical protein